MKASFSSHISEDLLEQYSLGRSSDEQAEGIEEHLLVCAVCQNRLDEVDQYIQAMKTASAAQYGQGGGERPQPAFFKGWPKPVKFSAAILLLLAVTIALPWKPRKTPAREVTLAASRGVNSIPIVESQAGGRLILRMDVSEIPRAGYEVLLVDSGGHEIWREQAAAQENQLVVQIPRSLSAGKYWVRLFDAAQTSSLIREYGLELK